MVCDATIATLGKYFISGDRFNGKYETIIMKYYDIGPKTDRLGIIPKNYRKSN